MDSVGVAVWASYPSSGDLGGEGFALGSGFFGSSVMGADWPNVNCDANDLDSSIFAWGSEVASSEAFSFGFSFSDSGGLGSSVT